MYKTNYYLGFRRQLAGGRDRGARAGIQLSIDSRLL